MEHTERVAALISVAPRLSVASAIAFLTLFNRAGRVVTYEFLADEVWNYTSQRPDRRALQSQVKRLRRTIPPDWPLKITAVNSVGYRMQKDDPDWSLNLEK